jgi:hypothetical protein
LGLWKGWAGLDEKVKYARGINVGSSKNKKIPIHSRQTARDMNPTVNMGRLEEFVLGLILLSLWQIFHS